MKLITKTWVWYLTISLPLLLLVGIFAYHSILFEIRENTDEQMLEERSRAKELILKINEDNGSYVSEDHLTRITKTGNYSGKLLYSDTSFHDCHEKEHNDYRMFTSYLRYNGNNYKVVILRPTFNRRELLESLVPVFALILGFLLFAFFILNLVLSKTLWKPFYKSLDKLTQYNLRDHKTGSFERAKTKEFNELNKALNKMTEKIHLDFLNQKEFTENASHEMQTPLAVIKAQLGLLMQSPHLSENDMRHIETIDSTVIKLASINRALLLLAKIENKQFKDTETISIREKTGRVLSYTSDFVESKEIILSTSFLNDITTAMNGELAEILISNLIQNAIRHNFSKGEILVELKQNRLIVSNTGEALKVDSKDLFQRFRKNDASKESIGLGLAIVKSICDLYGIQIHYSQQKALHVFALSFPG